MYIQVKSCYLQGFLLFWEHEKEGQKGLIKKHKFIS